MPLKTLKTNCLCATFLNMTKFYIVTARCWQECLIFSIHSPQDVWDVRLGLLGVGGELAVSPFSSHPSSLITSSSPTSLATTHTSSQSRCPCRHSTWPGHLVPPREPVNDKYWGTFHSRWCSPVCHYHKMAAAIKHLNFRNLHIPPFLVWFMESSKYFMF